MKIIKFKLFNNFKILTLILLGLINFNFSTLYGLHICGSKKESSGAAAKAESGSAGSVGSRTGDGSGAGSAISGAAGAGGSGAGGGIFKSHSDGDLSTLLARTVVRVGAVETKVGVLDQKLDGFVQEVREALMGKGGHPGIDERLSDAERRIVAIADRLVKEKEVHDLQDRYHALEHAENLRIAQLTKIPIFVGFDKTGRQLTENICMSPKSFGLYQADQENKAAKFAADQARAVADARNPQDNRYASDRSMADVAGQVMGSVMKRAEMVAEIPTALVATAGSVVSSAIDSAIGDGSLREFLDSKSVRRIFRMALIVGAGAAAIGLARSDHEHGKALAGVAIATAAITCVPSENRSRVLAASAAAGAAIYLARSRSQIARSVRLTAFNDGR